MKDFLVKVGSHEDAMLFLVRGARDAQEAQKQVLDHLTSKYSSAWGWGPDDISSITALTLKKGVTQL